MGLITLVQSAGSDGVAKSNFSSDGIFLATSVTLGLAEGVTKEIVKKFKGIKDNLTGRLRGNKAPVKCTGEGVEDRVLCLRKFCFKESHEVSHMNGLVDFMTHLHHALGN